MTKRKSAKRSKKSAQRVPGFPEPVLVPDVLPVLAAKDMVPFPGVMMSLYLSRADSIHAMEAAMEGVNALSGAEVESADVMAEDEAETDEEETDEDETDEDEDTEEDDQDDEENDAEISEDVAAETTAAV